MASIRFLGAAGTVTGSRFLVTSGAGRLLVLVHGEPAALAAAKARMDSPGWPARVPQRLEEAMP